MQVALHDGMDDLPLAAVYDTWASRLRSLEFASRGAVITTPHGLHFVARRTPKSGQCRAERCCLTMLRVSDSRSTQRLRTSLGGKTSPLRLTYPAIPMDGAQPNFFTINGRAYPATDTPDPDKALRVLSPAESKAIYCIKQVARAYLAVGRRQGLAERELRKDRT
jgi:hypothetical protein